VEHLFVVPDGEEENAKVQEQFEEDCFLPNPVPTSLGALPGFLKEASKQNHELRPYWLEKRRTERMKASVSMVDDLFSKFYQCKLFARGLSRCSDPLLTMEELYDPRLFVDYLPMLRIMSIHEKQPAPDKAEDTTTQRRTRRTPVGRVHYFATGLVSHEHRELAKDTGLKLAADCLATVL
jgi:hypothetical protein